jgi:cytidylate kinase
MKDVITIDGPSGAGKSTVSRLLARRLGYQYLDTGALYRAVAWKVKEEKIDIDDDEALNELLRSVEISLSGEKISVNGVDITSMIRTSEIGELSSVVSANPAVRKRLFSLQREAGLRGKVVVEGRDTGTAVFPEAEKKFYLDASVEERAKRRSVDLMAEDPGITLQKTIDAIQARDVRDSTRTHAPLTRTSDMVYIDSSNLTVEEVIDRMMVELDSSSGT